MGQLPEHVCLDTGRFLRGKDTLPNTDGGRKDSVLFLWNEDAGRPEEAPGSEGADSGRLIVEGFTPPIEGGFLEAREALPTHKGSPRAGGDDPFQLVSVHCRWSIHSTWRDNPLMLRLQRGEPALYLNVDEAVKLGLGDGSFAEIYNDLGTVKMRIKHSTMVRPGVACYFHAWIRLNFRSTRATSG